jgi:hypothetical protein
MKSLAQIGTDLNVVRAGLSSAGQAEFLLKSGEQVLENWNASKGNDPTSDRTEGFRLLALHRQGAKGDPSFNACRETCRELVYHYNLVTMEPDHAEAKKRLEMMQMVAMHLYLFVNGKMQVDGLGEFCCSSKGLRQSAG